MSAVFLLSAVFTGFLLVRMAWPNALRVCRHDLLRLSLGAGVGLAVASVVAFAACALAQGSRVLVIAADAMLFVAALTAYLVWRRQAPCPFCVDEPSRGGWILWTSTGVALLCAAASFTAFTAGSPYGEWDAWAIWNNHARFMASGSHWKQMFSPHIGWAIPDYPLLVPGAIANTWIAAGSESPMVPAVTAAIFLFGTAGVLFGTLDLMRGRKQALLAVVTLFGASAVIRMGASQYADVPLAFFCLATVAMLSIPDTFRLDRHSWWLAGMVAACAAWTKNEGMVFLSVAVAARAFASVRARQFHSDWKCFGLLTAGAAPVLGVLVWFKVGFAPPNYLFAEQGRPLASRLTDVSRFMTVGVEFGRQLFTFGGWLLPPALVAIGYWWLMGRSANGGAGRSAGMVALIVMTLAYAGVYVVTTKDLDWQIDTSLSRVLMQLWPAAVFVFFLYTREPREAPAPEAKGAKLARKTRKISA